jgi:hypothetical protein
VLLFHHQRKMASDDIFDTVSGSLGLTGSIDQLMILQRPATQNEGTLHGTGRDIDDFEWAMLWDRETARWSLLGDASLRHFTRKQQTIVDVLKQSGTPMKPSEVAPIVGMQANNCKQMRWQMAQQGKLVSNKDGAYSLPTSNPSKV